MRFFDPATAGFCFSGVEMERKEFAGLTEEEINHIADRAAERALERVYANIGKSIVKKIYWVVGLIFVSGLMFLSGGKVPHQ